MCTSFSRQKPPFLLGTDLEVDRGVTGWVYVLLVTVDTAQELSQVVVPLAIV